MERCNYCGQPLTVNYVHGHAQCNICNSNVMPCCQGAAVACAVECPKCDEPPKENCNDPECPTK